MSMVALVLSAPTTAVTVIGITLKMEFALYEHPREKEKNMIKNIEKENKTYYWRFLLCQK